MLSRLLDPCHHIQMVYLVHVNVLFQQIPEIKLQPLSVAHSILVWHKEHWMSKSPMPRRKASPSKYKKSGGGVYKWSVVAHMHRSGHTFHMEIKPANFLVEDQGTYRSGKPLWCAVSRILMRESWTSGKINRYKQIQCYSL